MSSLADDTLRRVHPAVLVRAYRAHVTKKVRGHDGSRTLRRLLELALTDLETLAEPLGAKSEFSSKSDAKRVLDEWLKDREEEDESAGYARLVEIAVQELEDRWDEVMQASARGKVSKLEIFATRGEAGLEPSFDEVPQLVELLSVLTSDDDELDSDALSGLESDLEQLIEELVARHEVKAAPSREKTWSELVGATAEDARRPYSPREKFQEGTVITHPTFGVGYVKKATDKIDVVFEAGTKTLLHGRG